MCLVILNARKQHGEIIHSLCVRRCGGFLGHQALWIWVLGAAFWFGLIWSRTSFFNNHVRLCGTLKVNAVEHLIETAWGKTALGLQSVIKNLIILTNTACVIWSAIWLNSCFSIDFDECNITGIVHPKMKIFWIYNLLKLSLAPWG